MTRSSRLFLFPDINVWVALTYERHVHHSAARQWLEALEPTTRLFFCRFTQLGFLRLLTGSAVMGPDNAKTQQDAWGVYDKWREDERVEWLDEPAGLEPYFRARTHSSQASPKDWADSYLATFAETARLTVVTFDGALKKKAHNAVLLRG